MGPGHTGLVERVRISSSSHKPLLTLIYSRVFGDDCTAGKAALAEPKETEFQRMTRQRAARRALPSSQTGASAPVEEQAADDSSDLA
jgi:hypothetical protein